MRCGFNDCKGELAYIPDDAPYNIAHWQCPICDSTYLEWDERIVNQINEEYDRIVTRTDTRSPEGGCVA